MKPLKRYQYEHYALLCKLAYPRTFKHTRYGFDPNGQRVIRNRHGQIFVRILWSKHKDEVVVVFKGSHALSDWLLNVKIWFKDCRDLQLNYGIHAGFYALLTQESSPSRNEDQLGLSVLQRIDRVLCPLIKQGKRVAFTGHSSGGAVACIVADYIETKYPKSVKRIVTFGQPAIGGWSFRRQPSGA